MDHPMLLVLLAEQPVRGERARVLLLLVGHDDERGVAPGRPVPLKLVEQLREGALQGARLELKAPVELRQLLLLVFPKPAGAAQGGMGDGEGEAGSSRRWRS